jgi:hypothetical protein
MTIILDPTVVTIRGSVAYDAAAMLALVQAVKAKYPKGTE